MEGGGEGEADGCGGIGGGEAEEGVGGREEGGRVIGEESDGPDAEVRVGVVEGFEEEGSGGGVDGVESPEGVEGELRIVRIGVVELRIVRIGGVEEFEESEAGVFEWGGGGARGEEEAGLADEPLVGRLLECNELEVG